MAYTPANFQLMEEFPIESTVKWFIYVNTAGDTLQTMLGSAFISDAGKKRVAVGDMVHIISQTAPYYYLAQVSALQTSGTGANAAYANTATMQLPGGTGGSQVANFRNLLDGGDFTVNPWQRGTTLPAVTGTTVTYTADRWFVAGQTTCSITVSQQAVTNATIQGAGFLDALQFARTSGNSATANLFLGQVLESADVYRTRGQYLTLSFWALAGANYSPTTSPLAIVETGTAVNEGSTAAIGARYAGSVSGYTGLSTLLSASFTPTTTWQQFTFTTTTTVPLLAAEMAVLFSVSPVGTAGSADYIQFAGVQLEIGAQATPFEHRDVELELALCNRYCFIINEPTTATFIATGQAFSATTAGITIPLPTPMRTAPTITYTAGSFSVLATTGTPVLITSAGGQTHHTITAIGLQATVASGLLAGYATILGGSGGTGSIVASCDL